MRVPGDGIPSKEELAAGAYPWDRRVNEAVIPAPHIAKLTWGDVCEDFGIDDDPTRWRIAIMFFWSRVSTFNGTVEDVWLLMKAAEEHERLLRLASLSNVDDDARLPFANDERPESA